MGYRREDLDAESIDLSDVIEPGTPRLDPVHPGTILREEFLEPFGLSVAALARALGVPRTRISDIALGRRAVTADTAMRLARYFGTSADFWLGLQLDYELDEARRSSGDRIRAEVAPRAA